MTKATPKSNISSNQLRNLELEIARLTSHVESETALTTQTLETLRKLVERHDRILSGDNGVNLGLNSRVDKLLNIVENNNRSLFGDGTENNPGVLVRVDRMQQSSNTRATHLRLLWTAIGSLAVGLAIELVKLFWWHTP